MYLTCGDFVNGKLFGVLNRRRLNVLCLKDGRHRNKDHLKINKSGSEMEQRRRNITLALQCGTEINYSGFFFFPLCGRGGNSFLEFRRGGGR